MGKVAFLLFLFFAVGVYASDAHAYNPDSEYILVSILSQTPDPVQPGGFFDARFKIENNGSETAENLEFKVVPEHPFSFYGDSSVKSIGVLGGLQTKNKAVIVTYTLQVSPSASDGTHKLKVAYRTKKSVSWVEKELLINVQSRYAILAIDRVVSEPAVISPGETANVTVKLKNFANSVMKDIKLSLALSPNFIPVNSSNEQVVNELGPEEAKELVFWVMPVPSLDGGSYSVTGTLTYSDTLGKNYTRTADIGLVVGSSPDLVVGVESTGIYTKGKSGSVVLKFTNKGLTDIKFLNVRLSEGKEYKVLSSPDAYIGKVDSDDYETAEFRMYVSGGKGSLIIPVLLDYCDANNNVYSETRDVELKLYSGTEAKKLGLVKGSSVAGIIIMLVIVGGGYFAYRKWKQRK